ncbi:MAG: hypothetical protein AAF288_04385 [Planctomycetota bacterium]
MARARSGDGGYWAAIILIGVLFVLSTTAAVLYYTKVEAAEQAVEEAETELREVVRSGDQSDPVYEEVQAAEGGGSVVSKLLAALGESEQQVDALEQQLATTETARASFEIAASTRTTELEQARADLASAQQNVTSLQTQLAEAETQAQAAITAAVATARENLRAEQVTDTQVRQSISDAVASAQSLADEASAEASRLQNELLSARSRVRDLEIELRDRTPQVQLTEMDGAIAAVLEDSDEVIIDLGADARVPLGLSFRVFKPNTVVRVDAATDTLEGGVASLQVFEVQQNTARARIVSRDLGAVVEVGDGIANVAYDPDVAYRFLVFGDFDLPGVPDGLGAERVRGLIRDWGGEVDPPIDPAAAANMQLSYQIDYVVLGPEPPLPRALTAEEQSDAAAVVQRRQQLQYYEAYQRVLNQAREARVPVLNQNRFLTLIGYYNRQGG